MRHCFVLIATFLSAFAAQPEIRAGHRNSLSQNQPPASLRSSTLLLPVASDAIGTK
jgi:hypothetical protein